MDTPKGGATKRELEAMIEHRSRQQDPEEKHELWRESERRHEARRQQESCAEWRATSGALPSVWGARAEEYDRSAQTLMEDQPKGEA